MKTKNWKRLLSLLLCACMVTGLLCVTAAADYIIYGDGWGIGQEPGESPTLYIENDQGMAEWINEKGTYSGLVYAVELAEGITSIPYHAFWKCTNLTSVEIPASVTEMGKNDVFEGCSNLESITVAAGNAHFTSEGGILYNAEKTDVLICPPGKHSDVILPTTVTRIAGSAFKGCAKLTSVTLHEGISKIENVAFDGCSGLTSLALPASLTSLGNGAFDHCAGLTSVTVAEGNAHFAAVDEVLYNKAQTTLLLYPMAKQTVDFAVPSSVTVIDNNAFRGNPYLQTVTAGALASIESSAFMGCTSLTHFTAQSLDVAGIQAFYDCSKLETFTLIEETSLKTIEQSAFSGCGSLTAAPLAGATSIQTSAFQNCTALTGLAFCETGSVSIGENAFSGCTGLTTLTFRENIQAIKMGAFDNCSNVAEIHFQAATPPDCSFGLTFNIGDPNNFQIIVPTGSEERYRSALGSMLGGYVGNTLVKKYPLFVNGVQLTSETPSIACGSGTASFDVTTSTLTLTDATIENMGGNYGYGGAINSGLANLTIRLVGTNTIQAEQLGYRDSISSDPNCNITIVSGETGGDMPTLTCDVIDMGRGGWLYNGGENAGNLTVDGVKLTVKEYVFVQHDITIQNGAQVSFNDKVTANHNATFTVEGEATNVTIDSLSMGNGTDHLPNNNKLELNSGTLTIAGSISYPYMEDTNPYAIHFHPADTGSIAINGGMFVKQASCTATNGDQEKIAVAANLPVQGNWESGTLIIGPEEDGRHTVTVKSDPAEGGVALGGGRYAPEDDVTLTAAAQPGWFFIGWYQDSGESAVSVSTEHTFRMPEANVAFTARFTEDRLYLAEQAKEEFDEAQKKGSLTWTALTDALDAYEAVPAFLDEVDGLLTEEEKTGLETRYAELTVYYQSITALNLSNQNLGDADLTELAFFTGVTDLDLSGTAITDLSGLSGLERLETLDISGTGVTRADDLVSSGALAFPALQTLMAKNLSLTSISALAELVNGEDFNPNLIDVWNFTDSTLPATEDNKADVQAIQTILGERFLPPTIQTTPAPPPSGGGGGGGMTTYSVTVQKTENGKVAVSPSHAVQGNTVTITVTSDDGYELEKLTVTDAKGNEVKLTDKGDGKYTFSMPGSKAEIKALFRELAPVWENCPGGADCPAYSFADVNVSAWYHEAVDYVLVNGLMSGYGSGLFGPSDNLSRAQLCQILYNKEGGPAVAGSSIFADVADTAWYADAVTWANKMGIVEGYGGGVFGPDDLITREQLAAILWRYADSPASSCSLDSFNDAGQISTWAMAAMQWACGAGIMEGSAGALNPQGNATRAEAATILMRFGKQYSK